MNEKNDLAKVSYNLKTIEQLLLDLKNPTANYKECRKWKLSSNEWYEQIRIAFDAKFSELDFSESREFILENYSINL